MRFIRGLSTEEIAAITGLSKRTIQRVFKVYMHTNTVESNPRKHGLSRKSKLGFVELQYLVRCIEHSPDIYLEELRANLAEYAGCKASISAISRALHKMGYTRKKITKVALERSEERRMQYVLRMGSNYQPRQLVFVDESSFDRRTAIRGFAWALRGERIRRSCFYVRGKRYSILPALSLDGMLHCDIVEGSYNAARFVDFVKALVPKMQRFPGPNSVLVMDNCSIHKDPALVEMIELLGMKIEFLPAYSPDLNPIEQAFSAIKASIRREHPDFARSSSTGSDPRDQLEVLSILFNAVYAITPDQARSFFYHSGYV